MEGTSESWPFPRKGPSVLGVLSLGGLFIGVAAVEPTRGDLHLLVVVLRVVEVFACRNLVFKERSEWLEFSKSN